MLIGRFDVLAESGLRGHCPVCTQLEDKTVPFVIFGRFDDSAEY